MPRYATLAAVLAVQVLGLAGWTGSAAAHGLPPFNVAYEGEFFFGKAGYVEEGSFAATGATGGADGALPLRFTKVSGGRTNTFNQCEGETEHTKWAIAPALNPRPGDWGVEETSPYPFAGWRYEISGYPSTLPLLLTEETCTTNEREVEQSVQELLPDGCPPANKAECEALFANLKFRPGHPTTRKRSVAFEVNGYVQRMEITVTVTSTAPGNSTGQPHAPHGEPTKTPPAKQRKVSEKRRAHLKQQAKEDFGPALEAEWQAHGLASVIGLGAGQGLASIAAEIGETASVIDGNDAGVRVLNDYRIYNDPAKPGYAKLAEPAAVPAPSLPSCAQAGPEGLAACEELRAAGISMLTEAGMASAIGKAMLTTIDRDTAAIHAGDYAAAAAQAKHFAALHGKFAAALDAQGKAGAKLASLLRAAGCHGSLTEAQSAAAIKWAQRRLAHEGVRASAVKEIAAGALEPRAVDALSALAHP